MWTQDLTEHKTKLYFPTKLEKYKSVQECIEEPKLFYSSQEKIIYFGIELIPWGCQIYGAA